MSDRSVTAECRGDHYPWQRFCADVETDPFVDDFGFLVDPTDRTGYLNRDVAPLSDFLDAHCVVLLGEPGIGKSTEFRSAVGDRLRTPVASDPVLSIDLASFGSELDLAAHWLESRQFTDWERGNGCLEFFFDSFDEGQLSMRHLASHFRRAVARLHRDQVGRLHLRFACRPVEWPSSFQDALIEFYGAAGFRAVRLLPLRRIDAQTAVRCAGCDPDAFIQQAIDRDVATFAAIPLTLKLMIDVFRRDGELPGRRLDLFRQALLALCAEVSASRVEHGLYGGHSARERILVASRVAASSVFCARPRLNLPRSLTSTQGDESLNLLTLEGSEEAGDGVSVRICESALREAFQSAIFSNAQFFHRTAADFLAADFAHRRELPVAQIRSLFEVGVGGEYRVAPQLIESAAWLAELRPDYFERLLSIDPFVLLRMDAAALDEARRRRLVERIVRVFDDDETHEDGWDVWRHLRKLAHENLHEQLVPVLNDRSRSASLREFAALTLSSAKALAAADALLGRALDWDENDHVRYAAVEAIAEWGSTSQKLHLKDLLVDPRRHELGDRIVGLILEGLWPELLTAAELFKFLGPAVQRSYVSRLSRFLTERLAPGLSESEFEVALKWVEREQNRVPSYSPYADACSQIVDRAWSAADRLEVQQALAAFLTASLCNHQPKVGSSSCVRTHDQGRRETLTRVIAAADEDGTRRILFQDPPLIFVDDLPWLLSEARNASDRDAAERWAEMSRVTFRDSGSPAAYYDLMLQSYEEIPACRQVLGPMFESVALDSSTAESGREHVRQEAARRERAERRQAAPELSVDLDLFLRQCEGEAVGDPWLRLLRVMRREASWEGVLSLTQSPAQSDIWPSLSDEVRNRIISHAKRYLNEFEPGPGTTNGAAGGYAALMFIATTDATWFDNRDDGFWRRWSPVFVRLAKYGELGRGEDVSPELARRAIDRAPDATLDELVAEALAESERHDLVTAPRIFETCWRPCLTERLLELAKSASLKPRAWENVAEFLVEHAKPEAIELLRAVVSESAGVPSSRRVSAASLLWDAAGSELWNELWTILIKDRSFFADVMRRSAHHHARREEPPEGLSECQLANLLRELWMLDVEQQEHGAGDDEEGELVSPDQSLHYYQDSALGRLIELGTPEAVQELKRLRDEWPARGYLSRSVQRAKRKAFECGWRPLAASEFMTLTMQTNRRLIRSDDDLAVLVMEELDCLQGRLAQKPLPLVRFLWDKADNAVWRPMEENDLSLFVAAHLDQALKRLGIVALREVQILPGRRVSNGGRSIEGERTDVQVVATVQDPRTLQSRTYEVVVETKGIWHAELMSAMRTQLVERYLTSNRTSQGIYLACYFDRSAWDRSDPRIKKSTRLSASELQAELDRQALQLSASSTATVRAFVLDCSLAPAETKT